MLSSRLIVSTLFTLLLSVFIVVPAFAQVYDIHDNAIKHSQRGQVYMNRARYVEATEEFQAALRLNPYTAMSASIYNNLGLAYYQLRQYAFAMAAFQHAIRIQPNYAVYYNNLVQTYVAAGQLEATETAMLDILDVNPQNAEAWFILGLVSKELGKPERAADCFDNYITLAPHADLAVAAKKRL